jgi:hypothetical protein
MVEHIARGVVEARGVRRTFVERRWSENDQQASPTDLILLATVRSSRVVRSQLRTKGRFILYEQVLAC